MALLIALGGFAALFTMWVVLPKVLHNRAPSE